MDVGELGESTGPARPQLRVLVPSRWEVAVRLSLPPGLGPRQVQLTHVGARPQTIAVVSSVVARVLGSLPATHLARLSGRDLGIDIIPADRPLSSLLHWETLGGQTTLDGTPWDSLEILGATTLETGGHGLRIAIREAAVGEEGVAAVAIHELAHVILGFVLDGSERQALRERFSRQFSGEGLEFVREYARANPAEYFAESTVAYFEVATPGFDPARFRRRWLRDHDSQLAAIFDGLYDIARPPGERNPWNRPAT